MSTRNTQMFALEQVPPGELVLAGCAYRLVRVFKHDFFAATCLYEAPGASAWPRIVVKAYRTQGFCGLGMAWAGRLMRRREEGVYRLLEGVRGVPALVGLVGSTGLAIQYVEATPLDQLPAGPPAGFFDRLRRLFDAVHARGVAYADANKRSNILVDAEGNPFLVDYQIAFRLRESWPRPMRGIVRACVRWVQQSDRYHLYKHKRRLRPDELTEEEDRLSRRRGRLHTLHRRLTDPWRVLRRRFLRGQHEAGRLVSPTAGLEDHPQPEKATWRTEQTERRMPNDE